MFVRDKNVDWAKANILNIANIKQIYKANIYRQQIQNVNLISSCAIVLNVVSLFIYNFFFA